MNETNRNHPNFTEAGLERAKKRERHGRIAATALAAVGLIGGGIATAQALNNVRADREFQNQLESPDALQKYKDGEIEKGKVVVIKVRDAGNGNADNLAVRINREGAKMKDLSRQVGAQADAQGYPGVEQGEVYVVDKELVEPEIAEQWAVPPEDVENSTR